MKLVFNKASEPTDSLATVMNISGNDLYVRDYIVRPYKDEGEDRHSVTSEEFLDTINAMTGDMNVWINSKGGELGYTLSVYNALMEHDGKVTTIVEGYAYSCASWLMLAGTEREIVPGGIVMAHNPIIDAAINSEDAFNRIMPQWRASRDSIASIISDRTGKDKQDVYNLMDAQTFMSADEAIKQGFCTKKRTGKATIPRGVGNYLPSVIRDAIPETSNDLDYSQLLTKSLSYRTKNLVKRPLTP